MSIRKYLVVTTLTTAVAVVPQVASAEVLNFDDLRGAAFFTSNYQGFTFGDNGAATNPWFYTDEQIRDANGNLVYQSKSPSTYIATDATLYSGNSNQPTQAITRSTAFVFDGAYFSGSGGISYQLFLNNAAVYSSTGASSIQSMPTFVSSGYVGLVDSVVVVGRQGFYALDDFTYRNSITIPAVPEPATWAMMLVGFGMVAGAARYRRRSSKVSLA